MKKWISADLEEIVCDFCGSRNIKQEYMRRDGLRVVECAHCGLAFLNPRPKPEFIPQFYNADYFTGASADRGDGGLRLNVNNKSSEGITQPNPRAIPCIQEQCGTLVGKKVLEIGCATGDLLLKMQEHGANVKGLEISEFAASIAIKRGLDVFQGTLDEFLKNNKETFDIIAAFEVIEHVLSPCMFVYQISSILNTNGYVILSTPNYSCTKIFRKTWLGFNASYEHIYFFSKNVLEKISNKCHLKLCYWETSISLGATIYYKNYLAKNYQRIKNFIYFIREVGFKNTFRSLLSRRNGYYAFGAGHTLIVVLKYENNK